ncbi:MAG: hypothetical protein ACM3IJ_04895 [Candidatus Levyibacteriota bacterium]
MKKMIPGEKYEVSREMFEQVFMRPRIEVNENFEYQTSNMGTIAFAQTVSFESSAIGTATISTSQSFSNIMTEERVSLESQSTVLLSPTIDRYVGRSFERNNSTEERSSWSIYLLIGFAGILLGGLITYVLIEVDNSHIIFNNLPLLLHFVSPLLKDIRDEVNKELAQKLIKQVIDHF